MLYTINDKIILYFIIMQQSLTIEMHCFLSFCVCVCVCVRAHKCMQEKERKFPLKYRIYKFLIDQTDLMS